MKDQPSMAYNARQYVAVSSRSKFRSHRSTRTPFRRRFQSAVRRNRRRKIHHRRRPRPACRRESLGGNGSRRRKPRRRRSHLRSRSPRRTRALRTRRRRREVIIRREISSDERNRVYINNQPSTVSALRELAPCLLDIHGQHEQQTLAGQCQPTWSHRCLCRSTALASKVRDAFVYDPGCRERTGRTCRRTRPQSRTAGSSRFQHDEIQKADPKPGETEQVRQRLDVLSNAGKLWMPPLADTRSFTNPKLRALDSCSNPTSRFATPLSTTRGSSRSLNKPEAARISIQDIAYAFATMPIRSTPIPRNLNVFSRGLPNSNDCNGNTDRTCWNTFRR